MGIIKEVKSREILDSRGLPTIEVDVILSCGSIGRASVPSGASTGSFEALELRDNDMKRFNGKGVLSAISNIKEYIYPAIVGLDSSCQRKIDNLMIDIDGTKNKERLGANAMLAVSIACAKASSNEKKISLYSYLGGHTSSTMPIPMMNIINGGCHADNGIDLQEFMIIPFGMKKFSESLRCGAEIYQSLKSLLKQKGYNTNVGDEGGFAPNFSSSSQALDFICESINNCGYKAGKDVFIAIDAAASEFYNDNHYSIDGSILMGSEMVSYYEKLVDEYPIISIEDPLYEEDWESWKLITQKLGDKIQLVGDDLFVTNKERLQRGFDESCANSILIKLNQIGTLTETMDVVDKAHKNGYTSVISHRSGETEDSFIADLSVATGSGQIKTGAPCRSERVSKYNQLLRIEEELGKDYVFNNSSIYKKWIDKLTV